MDTGGVSIFHAIMGKSYMDINLLPAFFAWILIYYLHFFLIGKYLKMAGHCVTSCLTSYKSAKLFSKVVVLVFIPVNSVRVPGLCVLTNTQ